MVKYSTLAISLAAVGGAHAFVAPTSSSQRVTHDTTSTTSLDALPPMIIGPMIRKMREENAKKRMPLATQEEAAYEAPGLRVGTTAWKWPPVWPFDSTFFTLKDELANQQPNIGGMAGLLTGQLPEVPDVDEEEENKFKPLEFWGVEHANDTTDLDPEAIEKIQK